MKISVLLRIIIWSIVTVLLVAILVFFVTVKPSWLSLPECFCYSNSDLYTAGPGSVQARSISEVEIHWVAGSVNVSTYSGDQIVFSESANRQLDLNEQMQYYIKNEKLIIQYCKQIKFFGWTNLESPKVLDIKIPAATVLKNIQVESVSSSVNIQEVSADIISTESVSGSACFSNLNCTRLDSKTVSGLLNVTGDIDTANIVSVSGSIDLASGKNAKSINAETVSGAINVTLPENNGFTVHYSSLSGGFQCYFPTVSTAKSTATYKDGKIQINTSTISGDTTVKQQFF